MGRLAGGVAHDFNNMLQVIRGYSKLLLKRHGEKDPSREYIQEIRKAEEQASSLTNHLLAFSRRQLLQLKVINLNEIIHEMQKMLCRLIGEDVELVTHLDPQLGPVKGDPSQMEQVIMNLAINARDAMPRGGRLILETANHTVDEAEATAHTELHAGPYILLTVTDTGTGMDPDTLSHIFEPFFTTKEKEKGTGLGLSTVYGIVNQSDGHILVHSETGQGTTFRIFLPQVDEMAPALPHPDHPRSTAHGTGTILLVEDEAGVRKLVAEILRTSGYTVLIAHHARDARSMAERHSGPIDLLITDVIMPDMNGREVADQLLAMRPDLKVLFMTGFTGDAILRYGGPDSFKPVIRKPFSPEALTRKVRELVGRRTPPAGKKSSKPSKPSHKVKP
jgi:CheY-like chemotaxis protein